MQTFREIEHERLADGSVKGAWWVPSADGQRIDCVLCPRKCSLKPGDRGFCFVRENRDGEMVLSTYGKSTGFCVDPIEKKPLNHFFPGTPVLSFGTAGCNLGCKFCQNWDISKSREIERLSATADPETIARAARETGCSSVAYTYNDPVIWAEYAIDTARACRAEGIKNVAVTAGYITDDARPEFFEYIDAANVDLKAFTEEFYQKITYSHLEPILNTLVYLKRETDVWFELTNLIIPSENDHPDDLRKMCDWIMESIGDEVPIHFTAFHPDFRMKDRPNTPPETLSMAQDIAVSTGIKYAYVGNVHDANRQSTKCHGCGQLLIERNWYELGQYNIDIDGRCNSCQTSIPGRFGEAKGDWGAKRQPIRIDSYQVPSGGVQQSRVQHARTHNPVISTPEAQNPVYQIEDSHVASTNEKTAETAQGANADQRPSSESASNPTMLNLDAIQGAQGHTILKAAASWVSQAVYGEAPQAPKELLGENAESVIMGVFVTLKRGEVLRGCCGVLGKPMRLGAALASAAHKTAKEDQRMAAISPTELSYLNIDVSLLGPFEQIQEQGKERSNGIEIGKHGLMIQHAGRSGLLLPSVATERGWDQVQFLQAVCTKAGLPISAWENSEATVLKFEGQSAGCDLAQLLPVNLPAEIQPPLNQEQLNAYATIAGQNIVALVTGGTPSYVVPHLPDETVNAIVLSMQWGTSEDSPDLQQGNALQVSFRPGVALQSTLYQMCQSAANMFQQQRFNGQLKIGLTVGFDPAMHGYGTQADLNGVDTKSRGVVISDARHCGFAFHPDKQVDELRDILRQTLPISSRDSAVHSLQVVSTMPHVVSISAPTPVPGGGVRPPAVAGKFYPAEDAARRAMVGTLFKADEPAKCSPAAIMVPHAGIKYSGKVAANVWRALEAPESKTMVIISPKHTAAGVNWAVCPFESWRLSNTTSISGDPELAQQIAEAVTPLELDAAAHQYEHGIEVQLPILEQIAPNAKVVGLALNGGSWEDIQQAATEFASFLRTLPELPLLVISSDMNHYAPDEENRRRDRLALEAMSTGDPKQLIDACRQNEISMCGVVPAAFVMETLRQLESPFQVAHVDYATSAEVTGDKTQVVGYAGALLTAP